MARVAARTFDPIESTLRSISVRAIAAPPADLAQSSPDVPPPRV